MNTATNNHIYESASYGAQITKQFSQLTFTQDTYLNLYCLELDFEDDKQQQLFMQFNEKELADNLQISCSFNNLHFKAADFMVLTKRESLIEYQLYITFERQLWMHDITLEHACSKLLQLFAQQDIVGKIELVEQFGVYLSIHCEFEASETIEHRIVQISANIKEKLDLIINNLEQNS